MRRCRIVAVLCVSMAGGSSAAQEVIDPVYQEVVDPSGQVVIRGRREARDGVARTQVRSDSGSAAENHAGDLIKRSPGARVLELAGPLSAATVSLRGMSADQSRITLDGVPLNSSAGGGFDVSLVPAGLLSAADVERGADGARLGAGAMGGTVHLRPLDRPLLKIQGGSLGTWGATASGIGRWGSWTATAGLDLRHTRGDFAYTRDPTPEIVGNDAVETLSRRNNDGTIVTGMVHVGRRDLSIFGMSGWVDRGLPGDISAPTPTARQRGHWQLLAGRWSRPTSDSTSGVDWPLWIRRESSRIQLSGGLDGEQTGVDVATAPMAEFRIRDVGLRTSGLLGQERFEGPRVGQRVRTRGALGLGLGWMRPGWSADLSTRVESWAGTTVSLSRLGGTWRSTPSIIWSGSIGQGFRPPSLTELYAESGPIRPNPDLVSERSVGADLGGRWTGWMGDGEVHVFGQTLTDAIVYETQPGLRAKPFNLGRASIGGVEAQWTGRRRLFEVGESESSLALIFLRTRNDSAGHVEAGRDLPYRPRARAVLRTAWSVDRWRATTDLQITASAFTNRANTRSVPGLIDWGAALVWRPGGAEQGWGATIEARNLLNQRDRAALDGYPLPGRTLFVSASWQGER